jgi:hypothetical protein
MRTDADLELGRLDDQSDADDRSRDAADAEDPTQGAVAFVGKIITDSSVPTVTGVFFKVQALSVSGNEAEGNVATKTPKVDPDSGDPIFEYAWLPDDAPSVPVLGDEVFCIFVPSRWTILY